MPLPVLVCLGRSARPYDAQLQQRRRRDADRRLGEQLRRHQSSPRPRLGAGAEQPGAVPGCLLAGLAKVHASGFARHRLTSTLAIITAAPADPEIVAVVTCLRAVGREILELPAAPGT